MRCRLIVIYGLILFMLIFGLLWARRFCRPNLPGKLPHNFYYGKGWSYVTVTNGAFCELTCNSGYISGHVDISKPVRGGQIKLYVDGSWLDDVALITNGGYRLPVLKGRHVVSGYAIKLPSENVPFAVRLNYATNYGVMHDTTDALARMPTIFLKPASQ